MTHFTPPSIRVLVTDDEPWVIDAYASILAGKTSAGKDSSSAMEDLRLKLYGGSTKPNNPEQGFEVTYVNAAETAVQAVAEALNQQQPFDLVFLDMRLPPGPDGVWAAVRIRAMAPSLDIVIVSAYSDVDPREISNRIPPADKLFYLQKPFHPHEIRQLAIALGRKSQAEAKMHQLAYYDSLTGLPNREMFRSRLSQSIDIARRYNRQLAVLFIDLDNFKQINDTLGHSAGDQLLKIVSERLKATLRRSDTLIRMAIPASDENEALQTDETLARLGGDEFTILLPEIDDNLAAGKVAARILEALAEPLHLAELEVMVTSSIGIAVYPENGEEAEALFKNADTAMYFAKKSGRNCAHYFSKSMNEQAVKYLTMQNLLRHAINREQLFLCYQPQVNLTTLELCGMEALIRWQNPELGLVPPAEFIPIAEKSGLIISIGEWVMRTACLQTKAWRDQDIRVPRVAVNISVFQFVQSGFPDLVARILKETGLPPSVLELELTESLLMENKENAVDILTALKELGVQLAIDDFGTGYSSLSRLRHFPIDRIKIDRSFIQTVATNKDDKAMTSAIISMAENLNLKVLAEGVETDSQLNFLRDRTCDEAQGYFVSKPLTVEQTTAFLKKGDLPFTLKRDNKALHKGSVRLVNQPGCLVHMSP